MPFIQNTIHLANKIKCGFLDSSNDFWFGNHLASVNHVYQLISDPNLSKSDHYLTNTDLQSKDRMNFSTTDFICHERVVNLLKKT